MASPLGLEEEAPLLYDSRRGPASQCVRWAKGSAETGLLSGKQARACPSLECGWGLL